MLRIGQVESSSTSDGKYTDGNVAGGIAATRLRAAAFNAMQEELAHIVESTGVELDVDDTTQVLVALQKIFAGNSDALGALAALTGAVDKLPYFNGPDSAALTALTGVGRDIIGKTTIADVISYLNLVDSFGTVGRLINTQTITSSGTYTPTTGTERIKVTLTGGGGGGGNAQATSLSQTAFGAGGGAGATVISVFNVSDIVDFTVTIGAGGTAQIYGGSSTFNGLTAGNGGGGGGNATPANAPGGAGGTASGGQTNIGGGFGSDGQQGNYYSFGNGGASYWGGGGRAGSGGGIKATAYGSGGGGAYDTALSGSKKAGGAGMSGVCVIEEYA
ncbi:TPA: carbohydrate kinase [Kluyvera ascorbata]|uniref:glycine-rich domain-containing protein n=1 Tax=Kluyvera genomosp. 2 TaxID=2774054 RepID=UPI0011B22588|nr:carbohydrate kinase [Kluyvera genomosp. 2]HAT3917662.1 carbohydrate kinase [Kluyvera ascorbata]HAT3942575.1 carbohydrate kinase [Kluyvera ascorbata]HAT3946939.1 carbohydrate kinase [Kluyvera ascorbata]